MYVVSAFRRHNEDKEGTQNTLSSQSTKASPLRTRRTRSCWAQAAFRAAHGERPCQVPAILDGAASSHMRGALWALRLRSAISASRPGQSVVSAFRLRQGYGETRRSAFGAKAVRRT